MKVPEAQPFLRSIAPFVRGINKLIQRMTLSGLEHIPRSGPAVIVANHTGYFDAMIIGEAVMKVGRAPHFVAGSNFFKVPGVAFVLRGVHAVKVTRETTNAKDSLDGIRDILDNGGLSFFSLKAALPAIRTCGQCVAKLESRGSWQHIRMFP